jgi:hypothetical protein
MPRKPSTPRAPRRREPAAGQPAEDLGNDVSMRDVLPDAGSYQSNHAGTGSGGDDERADADDFKVTGQSRG